MKTNQVIDARRCDRASIDIGRSRFACNPTRASENLHAGTSNRRPWVLAVLMTALLIACSSDDVAQEGAQPGSSMPVDAHLASRQEPQEPQDQDVASKAEEGKAKQDNAAQLETSPATPLIADAATSVAGKYDNASMSETRAMAEPFAGDASSGKQSSRVRILPVPGIQPDDSASWPVEEHERYASLEDNSTVRTSDDPVSTFSIDVDTGAYSNVRRFLAGGSLPPKNAVRIEEMINYFDYDYPSPSDLAQPFSVTTELGETPWDKTTRLLRVGLKGYEPAPGSRPHANLVFLVDVSGSMASPDKLGLLKTSLKLLASELTANDRVSIVVYAGASGAVLEAAPGNASREISNALDSLSAGGSTHGEAGIEHAYRLADEHFIEGGVNRVILATDGDFNVGLADADALIALIEKRRASGIALSTLGFGSGNYNDHLMEQLADAGNGAHAYIDTLNEARKVLVDELDATLLTVARDVKIQVEFNPSVVAEYRLLGYVNRQLADEDFNDDRVDAGEIGAGHTVTAFYEIAVHGEGGERHMSSRYNERNNDEALPDDGPHADEIAEIRLRYKRPDESKSRALDTIVRLPDAKVELASTSADFRFAAAVTAFALHLRGDSRVAGFSLQRIAELTREATGEDRYAYRADFVRLVETADSLMNIADPLTRREFLHDDQG